MRSSQYAASLRTLIRGYQEFIGAVCYQRSGCPDLGVCTSGFELLSHRQVIWASEARSLAATAFKAACKALVGEEAVVGGITSSISVAKYRPHRPHHRLYGHLQDFLAGGTKHRLPTVMGWIPTALESTACLSTAYKCSGLQVLLLHDGSRGRCGRYSDQLS
jgi:hypothetical protein